MGWKRPSRDSKITPQGHVTGKMLQLDVNTWPPGNIKNASGNRLMPFGFWIQQSPSKLRKCCFAKPPISSEVSGNPEFLPDRDNRQSHSYIMTQVLSQWYHCNPVFAPPKGVFVLTKV